MELKERIKQPTPPWFKKIIRLGLMLAGAGTALLTANATVPGFTLPHKLEAFAQWMVVAGLVASSVAKTAKETNSDD